MFIEKVTVKEIADFSTRINGRVKEVVFNDDRICMVFHTDLIWTKPTLELFDFHIESVNGDFRMFEQELSKTWRKVMYESFGEDYRLDFKKINPTNFNVENNVDEIKM